MALLVLLLLLLLFLQVSRIGRNPRHSLWKGHYLLLVRDEAWIERFEEDLEKEGYQEVIHRKNTEVDYFSFRGMQKIPLDEIGKRFEPGDPRVDWYMRHIPNLFTAEMDGRNWNVLFVSKNNSALDFYLDLFRITKNFEIGGEEVEKRGWKFPELYSFFPWIQGAVFLLFSMFLFLLLGTISLPFFFRERTFNRIYLLLGGFSWSIASLEIEFWLLPALLVLFLIWGSLTDTLKEYLQQNYNGRKNDELKNTLKIKSYLLLISLIASIVLFFSTKAGKGISVFDALLLPLFFSFGITAFLRAKVLYSSLKQEHRLFFPIKLKVLKPASIAEGIKHLIPLALILLFLVTSWSANFHFFSKSSVKIPIPLSGEETSSMIISWSRLTQSYKTNRERTIPIIADYIEHRMIQEGFPYGFTPNLPEIVLWVHESMYKKSDKRIIKENSKVISFDQDWLEITLNNSTLPAPMKDVGMVSSISLESPYRDMLHFSDSDILYLLPVFIVFPWVPLRGSIFPKEKKRKVRYMSNVVPRRSIVVKPSLAKLTVFFIDWVNGDRKKNVL